MEVFDIPIWDDSGVYESIHNPRTVLKGSKRKRKPCGNMQVKRMDISKVKSNVKIPEPKNKCVHAVKDTDKNNLTMKINANNLSQKPKKKNKYLKKEIPSEKYMKQIKYNSVSSWQGESTNEMPVIYSKVSAVALKSDTSHSDIPIKVDRLFNAKRNVHPKQPALQNTANLKRNSGKSPMVIGHIVKKFKEDYEDKKVQPLRETVKQENTIMSVATKKIPFSQKKFQHVLFNNKLRHGCKSMLDVLPSKKKKPELTLRERMMARLDAARFRYLNEQLYTGDSTAASNLFTRDPSAFQVYHDGYRGQVSKWPVDPLDIIIKEIKESSEDFVIADFGCGDGRLATNVPHRVHSLDLVALKDHVTVCNMAHTPLATASIDVAVFCLSLMGTNLRDYILEANRVLKMSGTMKIAEVRSRFVKLESFIEAMNRLGFNNVKNYDNSRYFILMEFSKVMEVQKKKNKKLPQIELKPCLYKKR